MFKKLLVCVDGSEQAQHAILLAANLACRLNAHVCLVHVLDLLTAVGPYSFTPEAAPTTETCLHYVQNAQQTLLQQAAHIYEQAQVPYQLIAALGNPVGQILQTAEQEQADLIVMGSRGLSAWSALLLGSVTEGVVHHARCPVLIVRGEPIGFHQILIPSDGSDYAKKAVKAGLQFAQTYQAEITVLNVPESANFFAYAAGSDHHPIRSAKEQIAAAQSFKAVDTDLQSIAEEVGCPSRCLQDRLVQETGHPGQTIVRYAENNQIDLIVLGSRGLGGFERLLLGSVSTSVLHHASCSVLVVR